MNETRILVVDDEEDLCEILKFNLENEGYEVDTANSAEEALKMDISSYHLILLDVMMGEISGFKMANMLKKDKKTAKVPIIFITAKDTENDTVTGFNLGADDYISKPFSLREVIARRPYSGVPQQRKRKEPPNGSSISHWSLILPRKRLVSTAKKCSLLKKNLKYCFYWYRTKDVYFHAKISSPASGAMKFMCSTVLST